MKRTDELNMQVSTKIKQIQDLQSELCRLEEQLAKALPEGVERTIARRGAILAAGQAGWDDLAEKFRSRWKM